MNSMKCIERERFVWFKKRQNYAKRLKSATANYGNVMNIGI